MVWKKIDNRIRILIENGVIARHRSTFVVVGEKAKDQVVILHHMLSKAEVKARPSVLWCYKNKLEFSTHRQKRKRKLERKIMSGNTDIKEDDPFELFIASTSIRYCYYRETHNILGQTFGMVVLQDFEALTPNLLARTVETVEGGGLVLILLQTLTSLKQLYTLSMDVHARYCTEAHQDIVARFNERFILSLTSNTNCLIIDDRLNILPVSLNSSKIKSLPPKSVDDPKSPEQLELEELKESFKDTPPVGSVVDLCCTADQAKAVLKFIDALSEKTLCTTVSLTSARGRGKSAALGFAIASAIAFNYSNVFVTSPHPENLKTLFSFLLKAFDALGYEDHVDYEVIQSTNPEFNKAVVRVNVFREHRQTVQYIHPSDANKLGQAELVVIDEAAAIPLPLVKCLLGPYLVFMASTINGYEGTGRSLSLKLLAQLRQQSASLGSQDVKNPSATGRKLIEITLTESVRYNNGDPVEAWLNELLCLDATIVSRLSSGCPEPQHCELYYVCRDTLFSYHKAAEGFLQRLVALFVASHYKNSPNDLLMMADAPAHHIFCLLPPTDKNAKSLPEVLCVLQVCLEGQLSKDLIANELSRGKRAFGDLIPWTMSQQFQDKEFPSLSGARVVRIATHPDYQKMGYGSRALQLLQDYYEGKILALDEVPAFIDRGLPSGKGDEQLHPRSSLPPLLLKLSERPPEPLDYIGVSYGLTLNLFKFWERAHFIPVYLRQTENELTGEHSCIMLKVLENSSSGTWLSEFWCDFRRRYVSLLSYQFRELHSTLALSILMCKKGIQKQAETLTKAELDYVITPYDLNRLQLYSKNLTDYHVVMDLLPPISRLYFLMRLGDVALSKTQAVILLCFGLQHKTVEVVAKELGIEVSQILGLFNQAMRKLTQKLHEIAERAIEETMIVPKEVDMQPMDMSLQQELVEAAKEIEAKQKHDTEHMKNLDFSEFSIKGSEDEWHKALQSSKQTLVCIKSIAKSVETGENDAEKPHKFSNKKKKFKHSKPEKYKKGKGKKTR